MAAPEWSTELLRAIQRLKREMDGPDIEKVRSAEQAYRETLDGFYEEHRDMISLTQYDGAKDDPDYFVALIQWVQYNQMQTIVDREDDPPLKDFDWKLFTRI